MMTAREALVVVAGVVEGGARDDPLVGEVSLTNSHLGQSTQVRVMRILVRLIQVPRRAL